MGHRTFHAKWRHTVSTASQRNKFRFTADAQKEGLRSFPGCRRYDLDPTLPNFPVRDICGCHGTMARPLFCP